MPAHRLVIASHLSPKEIFQRYRSCKEVVEREHWQIMWLLTRPEYSSSAEEAAMIVGRTVDGVRRIIRRYNAGGPAALADRRAGNSGRKPVLSLERQQELMQLVQTHRAPDGGLWSGPKVAHWVKEKTGKKVSAVTGWQYLRTLGFALLRPRPKHSEAATPAMQTIWKKNAAHFV